MRLLPNDQWLLRPWGDCIAAGIYEHPAGCVWWAKIRLSELPNAIISAADLARFGIQSTR